MDLGINNLISQLQEFQQKGFYLLTTSGKQIAVNLALNCLYHNSNEDCLRFFITGGIEPQKMLSYLENKDMAPSIKAHVYEYNENTLDVTKIVKDLLLQKVNDEKSLVVLLLQDSLLTKLSKRQLQHTLLSLEEFATENSLSVVLITHGLFENDLVKRLLSESNHYSGLVSFTDRPNGILMNTLFWREADGHFIQSNNQIKIDENGIEVVVPDTNLIASIDENTCYITDNTFTPDSAVYSNVKRFNSNHELFADAIENATAASVFLTVTSRETIDETAEYVYKLRTARGSNLKIIVIEKVRGIRANSEQFLITCGANFIFETDAKGTYINAMLPTLKTLVFQKNISKSFNEIKDNYHLIDNEGKGFLMPQDFILKVQNLISHNLEGSNLRGTLAKLTVKDGLTEKMCVSQFKPKRGGDYCTVMQGFIILYLPSCREGELAITLEHTFNTTPTTLFKTCSAVYTYQEIVSEIKDLGSTEFDSFEDVNIMHEIIIKQRQEELMKKKAKSIYDLADTSLVTAVPVSMNELWKDEQDA